MSNSTPRPHFDNDWSLCLRLVPFTRRSRGLLAFALILLIPLSLAGAVQPLLIGQVVSLVKQEPDLFWFLKGRPLVTGIDIIGALLLLTVLVQLSLQGFQGYLVQKVGQRLTADIRAALFAHVTSLSMSFFDRTPIGRLITRLTSDVEDLGDVFSTGAIGIVGDLFSILMIVAVMLAKQWQLALMLVLMLIPVTLVVIYFQERYRQANYRVREELSSLNSTLQENLVGINVVQLFRRQQFNSDLFRTINRRYIKEVDATIFYDAAVSSTLEWIARVATAGVLVLGGWQILRQDLDFGTLSAFIFFAQRLFDPLRQFAEKFTIIQAGFTAIERITSLLDEPVGVRDCLNPTPLAPHRGEIKFVGVWLSYKPGEWILQDLNFTIQPGEKVALVGPTGAGKTSIIRLLCRLYEPTRGQILLDGVDIREIPQQQLRRSLGVILQDSFLFAGDVKGNIALGESYPLAEIEAAAEKTHVADFINQLPQGYDTPLRERGSNLSGGQKQLIAFARAAIRNPQVLILDEATASLDVGTEALVQEALDRLLVGRTAVIIAHRLSTIRFVDRILVLKRGELIESGSHEELIHRGGLYASLHKVQMLGS